MQDEKKELARVTLKKRVVAIDPDGPYASSPEELAALGERCGCEALDLSSLCLPLRLLELIPRETAEAHCLLPVQLIEQQLSVVMADPLRRRVVDELEFVTGKTVKTFVAPEKDIRETIERAYLQFRRHEEFFQGPRCSVSNAGSTVPPPLPTVHQSRPQPAIALEGGLDDLAPTPAPELNATGKTQLLAVQERHEQAEASPVRPNTPVAVGVEDIALLGDGRGGDGRGDDGRAGDGGDVERLAEGSDSERTAPWGAFAPEIPDLQPRQSSGAKPSQSVRSQAPTQTGEIASKAVPGNTNSGVALVIEDDPAIAKLMATLLGLRGLEVKLATDGQEGLRLLKRERPRLVVIDGMLPGVHGFDIVRRMRASSSFREVPVIIVTAEHRGWEYAEDLRTNFGVEHYLEKPFETGRFLRALDSVLGHEPAPMNEQAAEQLRAGIEAFKDGQLDAAQRHLEQGLELDPFAFELHFHLGLLHGKRGHAFEAITAIKHAVDLNPGHFSAVRNLAVLYLRAGFRRKAQEMWQRALGLAPDEETRNTIRQRLAGFGA